MACLANEAVFVCLEVMRAVFAFNFLRHFLCHGHQVRLIVLVWSRMSLAAGWLAASERLQFRAGAASAGSGVDAEGHAGPQQVRNAGAP